MEDLSAPIPKREGAILEGANGSLGVAEWKPSGIPSVTVVPTVILRSVPAFLLRTPGGAPPLRRMSRSALAHLKGKKELSQGGYLAPPVLCAKLKAIPVEERDFSLGKGYSSAAALIQEKIPELFSWSNDVYSAKRTGSL
jgi:hypothetical protein